VDRTPRVSLLMPVFNGTRYLHEAIGSILDQTFTDFEFIIVDDGSTDHSMHIAQACGDIRVRVITLSHVGLVAARNRALSEARGKYIAWMDADDVSHPDRLSKQVVFMESHPHVVMLGTWARLIEADGRASGVSAMPPATGRSLYVALCASNQFINGSTMMRRNVACAVGGYRPEFVVAEDYDLALRLVEIGHLANLTENLYRLRVYAASTTARIGDEEVARYTRRAQQCALQRYFRGRDYIGYKLPPWLSISTTEGVPHVIGMDAVTRSDWAQIALLQGQFALCFRILYRSTIQPRLTFAPSLLLPHSMTKAYWREVLRAFAQGTWQQAGCAKVRRTYRRILERASA